MHRQIVPCTLVRMLRGPHDKIYLRAAQFIVNIVTCIVHIRYVSFQGPLHQVKQSNATGMQVFQFAIH